MCLLRSIPIKELFKDSYVNIKYRKIESTKKLKEKYMIEQFPTLLFFKEGFLLDRIEGYFDNSQKEELREKILEIIKT